jgi:hypothetical protein
MLSGIVVSQSRLAAAALLDLARTTSAVHARATAAARIGTAVASGSVNNTMATFVRPTLWVGLKAWFKH